MFDTTEKLRQYLLIEMGLQTLHIDQEDDGSLSAYLCSRQSLVKAFRHFADLGLDVTARHRPTESEDRYHLNVSPHSANLVRVGISIYFN